MTKKTGLTLQSVYQIKTMKEMHLTRGEEEVMLILWDLGEALVKDVRSRFPDPKPARNTISTVLRVLEKKGFVKHRAYSNIHLYFPAVSKEKYSGLKLGEITENYFNGSFTDLIISYSKLKGLSPKELDEYFNTARKEVKRLRKNRQ
jgi:predicted transcriptional regulator